METARAHNVPAYVIFNDATLRELARRPRDLEALRGVSGVGDKKLESYGAQLIGFDFLDATGRSAVLAILAILAVLVFLPAPAAELFGLTGYPWIGHSRASAGIRSENRS